MSSKVFGGVDILEHLTVSGTSTLTGVTNTVSTKTASYTVSALKDSGKIFVLSNAAGLTITLPAVASSTGFNARFIVGTAPTSGNVVIHAATACIHALSSSPDIAVATAKTNGTAVANINFISAKSKAGDYVEICGNGTNYFANANVVANDALTLS